MKKVLIQKIDSLATVVLNEEIISREIIEEDWVLLQKKVKDYNKVVESEDYNDIQLSLMQDEIIKIISPKIYAQKLKEEADKLEAKALEDALYFEQSVRKRKNKRLTDTSGIFEIDENDLCYLKGYNEPIPALLIDALLKSKSNPNTKYTFESLINFWKWLMLNPDIHVRKDLFKWLSTSTFSITEEGMIISYRNVDIKSGKNAIDYKLQQEITRLYLQRKKQKKSPKNYKVLQLKDKSFISKDLNYTVKFDETNLGILDDLYIKYTSSDTQVVYTDNYTKSMKIMIGTPVSMNRQDCDNDPNADCSRGLHQKSSKYNLQFGEDVLVCLVNPYNIVAIPKYDNTKFRCCEYLPISKAELKKGNLVEFEEGTYNFDYPEYTIKTLENMLKSSTFDSEDINKNISIDEIEKLLKSMKSTISSRKITI